MKKRNSGQVVFVGAEVLTDKLPSVTLLHSNDLHRNATA